MFHFFPDKKGIKNCGGFRTKASTSRGHHAFVILVTSFSEPEWPDNLDEETGLFLYYGDKRSPGDLHETGAGGNRLLADIFEKLHFGKRCQIPPFLIFQKIMNSDGTFMRFLGLAVPGAESYSSLEDLVAVWKKVGVRFQNYRSVFTILRESVVPWEWLDDLVSGLLPVNSIHCPEHWGKWVSSGKIEALKCDPTRVPRAKEEQIPQTSEERDILEELRKLSPREFEFAAREILYKMDGAFKDLKVTRYAGDGGHDILGAYRIGKERYSTELKVFVEAKHWKGGIGVSPVARLLSRMRHRDIGVFITTSWFNKTVQKELISDAHPIILISGKDISKILIDSDTAGKGNETKFYDWLSRIRAESEAD